MQSTSHSVEDLGSRLYAYGEPAEGSFTLGPMQSTSHSLEDWSRVGSAKGAQRGLTRADAANLTRVSIFERHQTPPSPRAVSRERGQLRAVIIFLFYCRRPFTSGCAIQSTAHAKRPAQGPRYLYCRRRLTLGCAGTLGLAQSHC